MTTLRRFTPPSQGIIHVQESILPDDVRIQIEQIDGGFVEVAMTKAQFRELCRLGRPDRDSYYKENEDQVRFQDPTE
jgi:hypothetical protein